MYKLLDILNTGAGPYFLRKDQLTPFWKTQAVHDPEMTKIHDTNDNPLRIADSIKHHVHVGRMMELVNFPVCKLPAVPSKLRCSFCDQFMECINPETRIVELIDASTVSIVRNYGKQLSTVNKNTKIVHFPKRNGCVSPKIRFAQHMRIPPFSPATIRLQTEREDLIVVPLRTPNGKIMKCVVALEV